MIITDYLNGFGRKQEEYAFELFDIPLLWRLKEYSDFMAKGQISNGKHERDKKKKADLNMNYVNIYIYVFYITSFVLFLSSIKTFYTFDLK